MNIVLYLFLIAIGIASIICGIIARNKINECQSKEEKGLVKAKWQLICGLLGLACMIFAGILIFTIF